MGWVGLIVISAVLLLFVAWWWSLQAFRRYVREYFQEQPAGLDRHGPLVREVGELFGVESREDDTVETYAARVREKARLPVREAGGAGLLRPTPPVGEDALEERA